MGIEEQIQLLSGILKLEPIAWADDESERAERRRQIEAEITGLEQAIGRHLCDEEKSEAGFKPHTRTSNNGAD